MNQLIVKTGGEEGFFRQGRRIAKQADKNQRLTRQTVVSFENPADLLSMLTAARLELLKAVSAQPGSITAIAGRLHRDRSAVKRDVDQLTKVGMLTVESQIHPGHGRLQFVRPVAQRLKLQAMLE